MSAGKDDGKRLHALMDALAREEESLSDKAVLEDAAAEGLDAKAEGDRVRSVLLAGLQRAKKERLERAKSAHVQAVSSIHNAAGALPADPQRRRRLLSRVVTRRPQMRDAIVTLQHREFDSLSDSDVESALRQLQQLGLVDEDLDPEE